MNPIDLLRLTQKIENDIQNRSKAELHNIVVSQMEKKMKIAVARRAASASEVGDPFLSLSAEDIVKMKWAMKSSSPHSVLYKNLPSKKAGHKVSR